MSYKNITLAEKQDYLNVKQLTGLEYIWCRTATYGENGLKR